MLDERDIQTIAQLMDVKLAPVIDDLAAVKSEVATVKSEVATVKSEVAMLKDDISSVKLRMDVLEEQQTRTALTIENIVIPSINTLVEGQELTHQMPKGYASKEELQHVQDQVQVLNTVTAAHSRRIAALEKAQ